MTTTALYKVLGKNADAIHGGSGTWHKPVGKRPGKWMDKLASVDCCTSGYHLVELYSLAEWLRGDCTIWLAEGRGATSSDGTGKTAFAQARLIRQLHISEQDLRLFAADCAEHVVHFYEAKYPNDDRPRKAIEATRAFARGEIGDAAGDAWAAAGTAGAAAGAAWAAAWTAAWAAGAAAGAAALDAAAAAAAAARAAAGAAALDAGGAAAAAARAAAGAAAGAAALDAGGAAAAAARAAAERQWQSVMLATYLNLKETS